MGRFGIKKPDAPIAQLDIETESLVKQEQSSYLDAMGMGGENFIQALAATLNFAKETARRGRNDTRANHAPCGGRWSGTVRQVTRINRILRNQARRDRKHDAINSARG